MPLSPEHTNEELLIYAVQDAAQELERLRRVLEKGLAVLTAAVIATNPHLTRAETEQAMATMRKEMAEMVA